MSALRLGCEARLLDPRIVGPSSLAAHRRRSPRVAAVLRWPLQSVRLLRLLWLLRRLLLRQRRLLLLLRRRRRLGNRDVGASGLELAQVALQLLRHQGQR